MRIVLINWMFILLTSYSMGYAVLRALLWAFGVPSKVESGNSINQEKYIRMLPAPNVLILFLGLAFVTAYAEIWSLFVGVATWADYVLIIFAMIVMLFNSKFIGKVMTTDSKFKLLIYVVLVGLFAYGTSRGYMHYDTNLYHAQAIRWIEEFGVVPGLANLQSRFGYNSSEFALNALYSWRWYLGQSLHTTAGFFGLISSFLLVDITHIWKKKDAVGKRIINIRLSDYVRLGLLFYLGIIYSEMISPASDYYAQLLIFDILIMWLDIDALSKEESEFFDRKRVTEYKAILCIILVYAITIKLSIGLLVLLALIPGIEWCKGKKWREIAVCIISGLVISVPYFVRNYIISGWILCPSTMLSFGSPDWQLPKGEAQYDAREIGMWGRGIRRAEDWANVTAFNWIKGWFAGLELLEKMWVLGTLVAIIVVIIYVVVNIIELLRNKKSTSLAKNIDLNGDDTHVIKKEVQTVLAVLTIGTIFWFCSAPLVRYGYAYLMIMPLLTFGCVMSIVTNKIEKWGIHIGNILFFVLAAGVVILKAKGLAADIIRTADEDYYIMQQDYIDGEAFSYEVDGLTVYVANDAGQIGYYKFPATPNVNNNFELRGTDVKMGFRHKD
ncbi:MAG: hypothetical protein KBS96_00695 [Lachnospiraceae bacterium]|nr:hypothetical protein [Candidatus Colinaster scatohippi]